MAAKKKDLTLVGQAIVFQVACHCAHEFDPAWFSQSRGVI
jgi:hypothetical protein